MLGWEFPPLLAGGLGAACYGLAKALGNHVNLHLIIPRAEQEGSLDNVHIKGLNHLQDEDLGGELHALSKTTLKGQLYQVEHPGLDPYPYSHYQEEFYQQFIGEFREFHPHSAAPVRQMFEDTVAYGPRIMQKVSLYTEVVSKLARKIDFDVIHAHDWITYTAAIKIRSESRKPLAIHVHSLETDRIGVHAKSQDWNQVYKIERMGIQVADAIIPVSKYTAQCAIDHYDADPAKITAVYNSIDPISTFRSGKGSTEKIVAFVGRVTYQKGPSFLLDTASLLLEKDPTITFAIAGHGDQKDMLIDRVYQRGLQEKVLFLGFLRRDQVNDLLSRADAYFMPSVSEPFGLSALEAGQFGVPCVISKQSGAAEVMDFSLTADYWDVKRFANYLYASINYKALKKTLVEGTLRKIKEMSWDQPAKEVLSVYKSLLN